jgi:hypothetical protein
MAGRPRATRAARVATAGWAAVVAALALDPVAAGAQTPAAALGATARNLVHNLAATPTALGLADGAGGRGFAFLAVVAAVVAALVQFGAARPTRERGRASGRRVRPPASARLEIVSPAGARSVVLQRDRAEALVSGDGDLVAQVLWSHDLGWCVTATWPHQLRGADGRVGRLMPLAADAWLRVADVRVRLVADARAPGAHARSAARAL